MNSIIKWDKFLTVPIDYETAVSVTVKTLQEYKKMLTEDNIGLNYEMAQEDCNFTLIQEDLNYNINILNSIDCLLKDLMFKMEK